MPASLASLAELRDRVDVWWCDPAVVHTATQDCDTLLSPEERARASTLRAARRRDEFVAARVLLRSVLSRYAAVAPQAWRFTETTHGKPALAGSHAEAELRFNVSHTDGIVVCAVTAAGDVGVDVEDLTRDVRDLEIAERFFARPEALALRELEPRQRRERFHEIWTLKEAYVKARGMGFAASLQHVEVRFAPGGAPVLRLAAELDDDARSWQLAQLRLCARFQVALCVRRGGRDELAVCSERFVPGGAVGAMAAKGAR